MSSVATCHQVNTELLTLQKVNDRGLGFLIPSYQRPYVWSDDDVVKLFEDIKEAFSTGETQYFIGSSLSARRAFNDREVYELIDGQQRTTTLMLISIAFKAKAEGVYSKLAEVSLLAEHSRLSFEIRDSVSNLLGSYAGLEKLPRPGDEEIKNDEYLKSLAANLTVLQQQVERLKKNPDFDLGSFADYLYSKVIWVNNIVPVTMDLNRLFASMNTAGIQLEPVDLLKARLLKKINTDKALYSKIWQACEHLENYFERNLRQLFPQAGWMVATSGFSVLRFPSSQTAAFYHAWLRSEDATHQLMRWNSGSAYPAIDDDVPLKILVPNFDEQFISEWGARALSSHYALVASKKLIRSAKILAEALIEGMITENQLVSAQKALDGDDTSIDRDVLARLTNTGIDNDGEPLFPDLDQLYDLLTQSQSSDE